VVAGVLIVVGAGVALAGVIAFRRNGTTVNPTTPEKSLVVVSAGLYRFTRNPMYLGFSLVLAGLATYLSNAASLLMLPVFVAYMTKFQIEPEERVLLDKFGTPFREYMATVRRWI
jgi:protein-S-isoprenylcysteine O-methyltransferase Ste14